MKQKLIGCIAVLALISPLGCLSDADVTDVIGGEFAESALPDSASAAGLLTDILGGKATDEIPKRELLAILIEFFAASASGSDGLMWDLAASAARDGRDGVRRSVAEYVAGQVAEAVVGTANGEAP